MASVIAKFLKESMCVSGTVQFDSATYIQTKDNGIKKAMLFELNDDRRGKFFIAWAL